MSKQLRDIPITCPIYDRIHRIVKDIKNSVELPDYAQSDLDDILDLADEMRNIAGDLREACTSISDSKDEEIEALNEEIEALEEKVEDLESDIYDKNDCINRLEYKLGSLRREYNEYIGANDL